MNLTPFLPFWGHDDRSDVVNKRWLAFTSQVARRACRSITVAESEWGRVQHSGTTILCDFDCGRQAHCARVPWNDVAAGMMRHAEADAEADARYGAVKEMRREQGLNMPMWCASWSRRAEP